MPSPSSLSSSASSSRRGSRRRRSSKQRSHKSSHNPEIVCCQHGVKCSAGVTADVKITNSIIAAREKADFKKSLTDIATEYENRTAKKAGTPTVERFLASSLSDEDLGIGGRHEEHERKKTKKKTKTKSRRSRSSSASARSVTGTRSSNIATWRSDSDFEHVKAAPQQFLRTTSKDNRSAGRAASVYIGVQTYKSAEEKVEKRTTFKLYHEIPRAPLLKDLDSSLTLHLVYKTQTGSYRHYPVEAKEVGRSGTTYYRVDCEKDAPQFKSIDKLVEYYQEGVIFQPCSGQAATIDLFGNAA